MSTNFTIQSSDPKLLEKATKIAKEIVQNYICDDVVGIVFLGAIVRGYFDHSADIDIAILKKEGSQFSIPKKFFKIDNIEVHIWLSNYESELTDTWETSKRWTYSQAEVYFDPQEKIAQLIKEKVPLNPEEKRWLMMSGLVLSEWYINRLPRLWIERGNIASAHHMFDQGLTYFFDMLFALNDELVADMKWRFYCAEKLKRLPRGFQEGIKDTMIIHSFSLEELERRQKAFMGMWEEMKPIIEEELEMSYDEFRELV